ncbi:MAG TPA: hypothetical protein VKS24_24900 [Bradyrhizobium sp.]|nr:hypothetical protein [Bradyrhizobium sp.]
MDHLTDAQRLAIVQLLIDIKHLIIDTHGTESERNAAARVVTRIETLVARMEEEA